MESNINVEKSIMTYQTKIQYIFTLTFLIYRTIFLIGPLYLPWEGQQTFFEREARFVDYAIVLIIFFIATILLALVALFFEKKSFFKKSGVGRTFSLLPVVWLCIWIDIFLSYGLGFAVSFTDWWPSGIGFILLNYGFSGIAISTFPLLLIFEALLVLCINFILPISIFATGMNEKRESKIRQKRKDWKAFGWMVCLIFILAIFVTITISLFFPWSIYTNFFLYMVSNFTGQNAWFFIFIILSLICLIFSLILIKAIFSTRKLLTNAQTFEKEIQGGLKREGTSNKLFFYWFICWTFLWIFLSISLALGITINPEESFGLLIYFNSAQIASLIGITMGMGVVLYYTHLQSEELPLPVPPRARSLSEQIKQFVAGFSDGVSEEDIQIYFRMLDYSRLEIHDEIEHLSNEGIINQIKIGIYKRS